MNELLDHIESFVLSKNADIISSMLVYQAIRGNKGNKLLLYEKLEKEIRREIDCALLRLKENMQIALRPQILIKLFIT